MKHNFVMCLTQASGEGIGKDCLYRHIKDSKVRKYIYIYIFLSSNIFMQIKNQRLLVSPFAQGQAPLPQRTTILLLGLLPPLYSGPPSGETQKNPSQSQSSSNLVEGKTRQLLPRDSSQSTAQGLTSPGSWGRTVPTLTVPPSLPVMSTRQQLPSHTRQGKDRATNKQP